MKGVELDIGEALEIEGNPIENDVVGIHGGLILGGQTQFVEKDLSFGETVSNGMTECSGCEIILRLEITQLCNVRGERKTMKYRRRGIKG
jgi:hypothetical protein